jgi:23S rRNA (adenine2030-N6)-methyltransferase
MNYQHAFHAGNHADVLKHITLLLLLEALKRKETPFYVLDTHAGRGRYYLQSEASTKTGEALGGIYQLIGVHGLPQAIKHYVKCVEADNPVGGLLVYPGSPLLIAQTMRQQDRLQCCEWQPEEAKSLSALFANDARVSVIGNDGYAAMKSALPPSEKRGLVLIDPPYEAQEAEFTAILAALQNGLQRWPTGTYALWYPIKQRKSLNAFFRKLSALPMKSALVAECLIRPDDSPLRLNGSGMLIINPPWQLDEQLAPVLPVLSRLLGEKHASTQLTWLKREAQN